jgi:hypothetical protein
MNEPDYLNNDEVIDFDGVIENDGEGFTTLPDGDEVDFTVTEIEKGRNKDGTKPQVKLNLACVSVNGHGRTGVMDYITMTRKSEWKLCELFVSLGMRKHGQPLKCNWEIVGRTGRATVTVDKYTGRDGTERSSNKIKHYLEPAGSAGPDVGDGGDSAFA